MKLASSKSPTTTEASQTQSVTETITESNTQTPQIPTLIQADDDTTTTVQIPAGTTIDTSSESITMTSVRTTASTEAITSPATVTETPTTLITTTVAPVTTTVAPTTTTTTTTTTTPPPVTTTTEATTTSTQPAAVTTTVTTTTEAATTTAAPTTAAPASKAETETIPTSTVTATSTVAITKEEAQRYHDDAALLQAFLDGTERIPKKLNFNSLDQSTGNPLLNTKTTLAMTTLQNNEDNFLQELLSIAGKNPHALTIPNIGGNIKINNRIQTTTVRSIEDDIRQFEEDTKLLKALLQATGQNPANFNIPSLDIKTTTVQSTTETVTTSKPQTTTPSIQSDAKQLQLQENAKLLQALLQATGQSNSNLPIPVISGITSNVRIASNPYTTSLGSSPTTPINVRPVYTTLNTSPVPRPTTIPTSTVTVPTTLQPRNSESTTVKISTTFPPFNQRRRISTTTSVPTEFTTVLTARRVPISRFTVTTEIPTSSTFSVEEDLAFLNNLVLLLYKFYRFSTI